MTNQESRILAGISGFLVNSVTCTHGAKHGRMRGMSVVVELADGAEAKFFFPDSIRMRDEEVVEVIKHNLRIKL